MNKKKESILSKEVSVLEDKREKCVICGAVTEYSRDVPIGNRWFYIEYAGQLCPKCYHELYGKKSR